MCNLFLQVLEISSLCNGIDIETDCSPDFDFPSRGSIAKSETSENSEGKKVISFLLL